MFHEINNIELKLARYFHKMSLQEVADKLNISRQYLHQFETGQKSAEQYIGKLADIYEVKPNFFMKKEPIIQEEQVHFRKLHRTKDLDKQSIISTSDYIKRFLEVIEKEGVIFPKIDLPDLSNQNFNINNPSDIERIAEYCRKYWDLGQGAISNMTKLCESKGIFVLSYDNHGDNSDIDALSVALRRPIIVRSSIKKNPCRLRFDLAHELGHLLLHEGIVTGCRETESQANHFAGAFLLPRTIMLKYFPKMISPTGRFSWNKISEFKMLFKVNKSAILYRAKQLSLITEAQYRKGVIHLKNNGEAIQENEDKLIEIEIPSLIENCLASLAKHNKIYIENIANAMDVQLSFLEKLLSIDVTNPLYSRKAKALKVDYLKLE